MAADGRFPPAYETFSARYGLPTHIVQNIGDTPWETVVTMAKGFPEHAHAKSPEIRKLQKEISLKRMLLTEMALEQARGGRLDPRLLVDLVKLLGKCEKLAKDYDLDLHEFNSFLSLVIEKVKREKLARHAPNKSIAKFAPMEEAEIDRMKKKSETYRGFVRKASRKKKRKPGKK